MPPSGSLRGEKEVSTSNPRRKRSNTITTTRADYVPEPAQGGSSGRNAGQLQARAMSSSPLGPAPRGSQDLGSREMLAEALEPVQTHKPSSGSAHAEDSQQQRSVRHAGNRISKLPSLKRISEAMPEPASPELGRRSRKSLDSPRVASTMPSRAQQPPRHPSSNQDLYRTLPRGFDPASGRVKDDRQNRAGVPYIFSEQSPQVSPSQFPKPPNQFPNPHGSVYRKDYQLSTAQLQRQVSDATLLAHMRVQGRHLADQEIPPTLPLGLAAPFGSPRGPTAGQLQAQAHAQARRALAGYQTRTLPFSMHNESAIQRSVQSEWSSEESTPTPTVSSISAAKVRNEKLQAELVPIQLIHPSAYTSPVMAPAPKAVPTPAQQPAASFSRIQAVQQSPQQVSLPSHRQQQSPRKGTEAQSPMMQESPVVSLKDGKQVPAFRSDFQNLKRILVPKPGSRGTKPIEASTPTQLRSPVSQRASGSTLAGSGNAGSQKSAVHVPGLMTDFDASALTSTQEASGQLSRSQSGKRLSVGGYILGSTNVALPRKDGSARPIYSPASLTLAAARQQDSLADKLGTLTVPSSSRQRPDGISSPLSASISPPAAPHIPHQLRFRRSEPNIGTPDQSRPGTGTRTPPVAVRNAASNNTKIGARKIGLPNDDRRNTFGEFGPSMLDETNRNLLLYQQQQDLEDDLRASQQRGMASGSKILVEQPIAEKKTSSSRNKSGSKRTQRRSDGKSTRNRNDSFGSATTILDSPSQEEFQGLARPSSRKSEKRRSIVDRPASYNLERKPVAGGFIAPPSDVPKKDETVSNDQSDDTEYEVEGRPTKLIISTRDDDSRDFGFRFIPISSIKAAGKARRPHTGNTKVSFVSNNSRDRRNHATGPACRQCFRAGFDCAMNLQLGEGTAGRRALQDFVAAGGLQALSIRDGGRQNPNGSLYEGSVTVRDALGRNYVDKLGDIAFGESALSRPVTRGMIDNLLEEKEEQEMRGRFVSDHKPWAPDVEDEPEKVSMARHNTRASAEKKQLAGHRMSQLTLNDGTGTVLQNIDLYEPIEKTDIDPADYDNISGDTTSDELDYLADRWPLWKKFEHLFIFGIYIFSMQALGAGYVSAIPSMAFDFKQSAALTELLGLGLLAFNGSQGGGFLLGCGLLGFGRQRLILISLVLAGGLCVIAGFSKTVFVTLVLQVGLGQIAGFSLLVSLVTMVDLFTTYTTRLAGLVVIIFAVAAGQFAGPWIAQLILAHISWTWQFWIMLIVAVILIVATGLLCPETNPSILFRRQMLTLQRVGGVWTPEPQPVTSIRQVFKKDLIRPFRILFSSWLIPAIAISVAFFLAIFVFMEKGIIITFTESHGLSPRNGALASTVGGLIGLLAAIAMLFIINCRHSIEPDMRLLHIDEKGYIDTTKPERKVEKVLVGSLVGSALFSLSMYTLALTAVPSTSWIFSAFGVVLHTAGVILVSVSALQYILDAYTPARPVELHDVIAREQDDPYTSLREAETEPLYQRDKRWTNETAICAMAIVIAITVTIANAVAYPAQHAFESLSFQAFAVIYASVTLLFTGGFLLVYLYGMNARLASIARLDTKEKSRNLSEEQSSTHVSRAGSRELYLGRIVAARNDMDFDEIRPLTPVVQREEAQTGLMAQRWA